MRLFLLLLMTIIWNNQSMANNENFETATFGAGCFWCVEAVFTELKGVHSVTPGYAGGMGPKPTYEAVCTGNTGYAEVAQISFDPEIISYKELLEVFWKTHDPTTLNKQGADVGTQYRSVIFYHNPRQKQEAEFYLKKVDESGAYSNPVVTEIVVLDEFYEAENYHNDYFENNPEKAYCRFVIQPKVDKFRAAFADKLK
jgi:peptide-methionine (S)-S-oxide reductase